MGDVMGHRQSPGLLLPRGYLGMELGWLRGCSAPPTEARRCRCPRGDVRLPPGSPQGLPAPCGYHHPASSSATPGPPLDPLPGALRPLPAPLRAPPGGCPLPPGRPRPRAQAGGRRCRWRSGRCGRGRGGGVGLGWAGLGTARHGSARLGTARHGTARLGSAVPGAAGRCAPVRPAPRARLGHALARLGWARARLGTARHGRSAALPAPVQPPEVPRVGSGGRGGRLGAAGAGAAACCAWGPSWCRRAASGFIFQECESFPLAGRRELKFNSGGAAPPNPRPPRSAPLLRPRPPGPLARGCARPWVLPSRGTPAPGSRSPMGCARLGVPSPMGPIAQGLWPPMGPITQGSQSPRGHGHPWVPSPGGPIVTRSPHLVCGLHFSMGSSTRGCCWYPHRGASWPRILASGCRSPMGGPACGCCHPTTCSVPGEAAWPEGQWGHGGAMARSWVAPSAPSTPLRSPPCFPPGM
ncbi:hypothetical protein LUU34_00615200 [Aix galericulata]|nr:hypothetical protein LUU34_00615200 [Aix galericulata]